MFSDDPAFFDLSTPDPEFPDYTARPEDQLPGRLQEGKIAIDRFFASLTLFITEGQKKGPVNGNTIYDHLKVNNLPVLGPNVGQFLYEHQDLIPTELRGKVLLIFWKIYRDMGGCYCVWCLFWNDTSWIWEHLELDSDYWFGTDQALLLARQSSSR